MDVKLVTKYRKQLLEEKERILNNSRHSIQNELAVSPDDLADETDLAASELNQHLIFKLRERERHLLGKIDEALSRMDDGSFGTCMDCEEPIEAKRLEARPVSTLCLSCKEREERREKVFA